jgi:hypothetical protein
MAAFPYWHALYTLPVASNNIYEQQYQMHRFATEYVRGPVAVNDVGWVSYKNPAYVLDLWGIASRRALRARQAAKSGEWMEQQTRETGAQVAMIYDSWFPRRPPSWTVLAHLNLSRKVVSAGKRTVTFYATDPSAQSRMLSLLHEFSRTLPAGVKLTFPEAGGDGLPASAQADPTR